MKRGNKSNQRQSVAFCAFEINDAEDELRLLPAGKFQAKDGRPHEPKSKSWFINSAVAERVIARAKARTDDMVIDYEHQTLHAEDNGQPAPAAGWFKNLEWRESDGLYIVGHKFTAKAKQHINDNEYRYLSAVFPYDKETGEVLDIYQAALTNYPAIDGLGDLSRLAAARFSTDNLDQESEPMNEELLKLLGLKKDADDKETDKAIAALSARISLSNEMRKALGLKDNAETKDIEPAVAALKTVAGKTNEPDPAKFVPVAVVEDLKTEVAELSAQVKGKEVDELVDVALSEGKLLPAQEEWARKLGTQDVAQLKSYLDSSKPIAALRNKQTDNLEMESEVEGLNESELAVCKNMGMDPEEFKNARDGKTTEKKSAAE